MAHFSTSMLLTGRRPCMRHHAAIAASFERHVDFWWTSEYRTRLTGCNPSDRTTGAKPSERSGGIYRPNLTTRRCQRLAAAAWSLLRLMASLERQRRPSVVVCTRQQHITSLRQTTATATQWWAVINYFLVNYVIKLLWSSWLQKFIYSKVIGNWVVVKLSSN